jgi:CID domain
MVAEDFADSEDSSQKIYRAIRDRLLTCESSSYVLPVMYVLDSILKNNNHKQQPQIFRTLVEQEAAEWMPKLHKRLDTNQKQKLQKVWRTWYNDTFRLFEETTWKTMGQCFTDSPPETTATSTVFGIARTVRFCVSWRGWIDVSRIPKSFAEGRLAHYSIIS